METDQTQQVCVICGQPLWPSDGTWTLVSQTEPVERGEPDLEAQEIVAMAHSSCWEQGEWQSSAQ